jgi:hypothetical protein
MSEGRVRGTDRNRRQPLCPKGHRSTGWCVGEAVELHMRPSSDQYLMKSRC